MKMKNAILVLGGAMFLLWIGIGLWFATMPYPISDWWKSLGVRYLDEWPITESDFAAAKRLVKPHFRWREIITRVRVPGPEEIIIGTTTGQDRVSVEYVIKKVNGEWVIVKTVMWGRMYWGERGHA